MKNTDLCQLKTWRD